jgi:hypothetical protein
MSSTHWLRNLKSVCHLGTTAGKNRPAARSRPSARYRPRLEVLEPRIALSHTPLSDAQPNIVFIMSDDQDVATMQYMPRVQELLADQGVTFENSFVTEPQCCPSNVTMLTGQYAHNHGVLNNLYPTGGFQTFVENGGDQSTIATWLQDAGSGSPLRGRTAG